MTFKLFIMDNFHYNDPSAHYEGSETFDSLERAIEAAKQIVDEYLESAYKPGMRAAELWDSYVTFGEDPIIEGPAATHGTFSAWEYAREQCDAICRSEAQAAGDASSDT